MRSTTKGSIGSRSHNNLAGYAQLSDASRDRCHYRSCPYQPVRPAALADGTSLVQVGGHGPHARRIPALHLCARGEHRPVRPYRILAAGPDRIVKDIRRATRKRYSAEEKIRIVLDGLRGEHSIAELCRREGIAEGLYYSWSKEFLEAGKRRLAGDTARAATSDDVKDLKRQAQELKEVVAEQALELRLLKKSMIADGGDEA
jgi:transposase